jgi:hypothetical protein
MTAEPESAAAQREGSEAAKACLIHLVRHGLLMKADAKLPSVTTIVTGEPVRGSWWAHPLAHTIFFALRDLESHPDLLLAKLVAGKDTFVHRRLWPEFTAIALAREPWQTRGIRSLIEHSIAAESIEELSPAVQALESRLLVHGIQAHTPEGRHRKQLETWQQWAARAGQSLDDLPTASHAKRALEALWPLARWPWQKPRRVP